MRALLPMGYLFLRARWISATRSTFASVANHEETGSATAISSSSVFATTSPHAALHRARRADEAFAPKAAQELQAQRTGFDPRTVVNKPAIQIGKGLLRGAS